MTSYFADKKQTALSGLYFCLLIWGLSAFDLFHQPIAVCFVLFLLIVRFMNPVSLVGRLASFFVSVYFVSALWSYLLEGKFFGEGFWAHASTGSFSYLLAYQKQVAFSLAFYLCAFFLLLKPRHLITSPKFLKWVLLALFILGPLATTYNSVELFLAKGLLSVDSAPDGASPIPGAERFFKSQVSSAAVRSPKNIIFLVMEGIESEYFNESRFPGLMPNMQSLKKEGLYFSNFHQQPGAWTTGGLLASTCGIYITALSQSVFDNDVLLKVPTVKLNCLGDMLSDAGWDNFYFQGTDLRFANLGRVFTDHKTKIFGIEQFKKSEQHEAGAYDHYLFRNIKSFIAEDIDPADGPYFLSFINYDTHAPGFLSPDCPAYENENKVVRAAHCYDRHVGDFVSFLKTFPSWKDTLVFIFNDHLSMANFQNLKWDERKNFLLILGAGVGENNSLIYHVDIPKMAANMVLNDDKAFPLSVNPLVEGKGNDFSFDNSVTRRLILFMEKNLK